MEHKQVSKSSSDSADIISPYSLVPAAFEQSTRYAMLKDTSEVGNTLALAFAEDSLSIYLLDIPGSESLSDEKKWKLHVEMMKLNAAWFCAGGAITTTGPDYEAVALWGIPGKDVEGWWPLFRSGLWKLYYKLPRVSAKRFFHQLLPILHDAMLQVLGNRVSECYYLSYLGTKPGGRGKGYASRLLRHMMAKADTERRPMYLESTLEKNDIWYAKFGFTIRREVFIGEGQTPIKLRIMVREPEFSFVKVQSSPASSYSEIP